MLTRLRRLVALLAEATASPKPGRAGSGAPWASLPTPGPLAADAGLQARSAGLAAGRGRQLAALDGVLSALRQAGRLRPDQIEYAAYHRRRFAESLHAIDRLLRDNQGWPACRVLEVGSSITPMLYHGAFPALRLSALCLFRHPQLDGIVEQALVLDLEKAELRGEARLPVAELDMVMLCEVLEHLVVNPANLFRFLATGLKPGGLLYVTTPNFFRDGARRALAEGRNPQPVFPAAMAAADRFHHHVREYAMAEVLGAMEAAGLALEAAYYSDCWDTPEAAARLAPDALQNLVVVGRKPSAD